MNIMVMFQMLEIARQTNNSYSSVYVLHMLLTA